MIDLAKLKTAAGEEVIDVDGTIPVLIWLEIRFKELNITQDQQLAAYVRQRLGGGLTPEDMQSIENQKLLGELKHCSMVDFFDYVHEIFVLIAVTLNVQVDGKTV